MEAPAAQRQLRAASVETVELAGIRTLKILVMVNTRKEFPRGILDQVISLRAHDGECERAPGPGLKLQAASSKQQAASKPEPSSGSSFKLQAPSDKRPNQSSKRQASSHKQQAS